MTDPTGAEFTRLLDYLRLTRGFDFTGYKMSSLTRRMRKRMAEVGIETYADYLDYLEVHPDEFGPLFNTVLINVTGFFRDPEAWRYLADQILPRVIEEKGPNEPVRVWSAGCASGQEAYSIAMLLAECLGEEAYKRRVKIYATDADDDALGQARIASYDERQLAEVPPKLLTRYFEPLHGRHVFRNELRRSLIFGRHDLVQDAAISRIDLLICRNTLMYFNVETQASILARFHFAVAKSGFLFLGKAETLLSHSDSFRPIDLKRRVFQRTSNAGRRDRLLAISPVANRNEHSGGLRQARLRDAAFESGLVAQLVVDRRGCLIAANQQARRLFKLTVSDRGRLLQDLEVSYRPVDLRSAIDAAYSTRAPVRIGDITWPAGGENLTLELHAWPLLEEKGGYCGASIAFIDLTQAKVLKRELERTNQELETASEELQSANEELETTNEELQSTVEELETTNEELQSANEELETMNEELQATNEELRTINDQLHQSGESLNQVNDLFESILGRLEAAVAVLEHDLTVLLWSKRAEDIWGLRREEAVGAPFFRLDIGIPLAPIRQAVLEGLGNGSPVRVLEIDGVNRRGKAIQCRVTLKLLDGSATEGRVLVLMEGQPRGAEA